MTTAKRTALVLIGLAMLTLTYFAAVSISVGGGCATEPPGADCGPIQPWAAILPIAVPLGVLFGAGSLLLGLVGRRR